MKLSTSVRTISHLKTHASEILRDLAERQQPLVITQNGEARAVLQDVHAFEQTQESLALLRVLAMSRESRVRAKTTPLRQAFTAVRRRVERDGE